MAQQTTMLNFCIDKRMGCEALKKLRPEGYNPQVWELAIEDIDLITGIEQERADEQQRNIDLGMLLAEAEYLGFINGIMAVRRYMAGIPGVDEGTMLRQLIKSECGKIDLW